MPVGFARSLLGGNALSLAASSQAATVTNNNTSFTGTNKFGGQSCQTVVSASTFDSLGYVTVYPKDTNFNFNKNSAWTIEFWLGHITDAPSSSTPAGLFRLEGDLLGTIGGSNGTRIIQYSDGQPRFRFYGPGGDFSGEIQYSSLGFEHIALVCQGSGFDPSLRWYANGNAMGSHWSFFDTTARTKFSWGQKGSSGFNNGRVFWDEMRVSNIARYSGNSYTVPTSNFTTDQNTLALIGFDGDFSDRA